MIAANRQNVAERRRALENRVIVPRGTGNGFGRHESNVVKLYGSAVVDGIEQVGYNHPGVGTMGAPNPPNKLAEWWSMLIGPGLGGDPRGSSGQGRRWRIRGLR
jgi:hypothetical protein